MAKVYGFRDQLARPLVDLARERLTRPHIKTGVKYPERKLPALRGYVLQPQETIAAATKDDSDGTITLGCGDCWILRRDQASGESSGDDGKELKYQLDDNGNRVTVTAFNLCPEAVEPGGDDVGSDTDSCEETNLVYGVQDVWGDLYIVERCSFPCGSSSSSSSPSSSSSSSGSPSSPSSGSVCLTCFDGLCLDDIPTVDNADDVAYVLGETNAGCLVKVPLSLCTSGGSSSSSGS